MKTTKKIFSIIAISTCFALTACSSTTEPNNLAAEQEVKPKKKTCIAGERTGSRLARKC